MTIKIGTMNFVGISGTPGGFGRRVRDVSRPGRDGHSFILSGDRGAASNVTTIAAFASQSAAANAIKAYEGMEGSFQNITDANGFNWSNVAIIGVASEFPKATGVSTDGSRYMVVTHWTMQRTKRES